MPEQKTQTQTPTKMTAPSVKDVNSVDNVFNDVDNQEIKTLIQLRGIYIRGAVEPYEYKGQTGESAFVQILKRTSDDSVRMGVETIKVRDEQRGIIDILNSSKALKPISLDCEIVIYGKQANTFLCADQPALKIDNT